MDVPSGPVNLRISGESYPVTLRRHRFKLYASVETCLRIDFDDETLAGMFVRDDIESVGLSLKSVHGLLDASGMLKIVKIMETTRDVRKLSLQCVNDMHFKAAATAREDHAIYAAIVEMLTQKGIGRALSELPMDCAVPEDDPQSDRDAYLGQAFYERPWRCCLFLLKPDDIVPRDQGGLFESVETEEYFAPRANQEAWFRGRVGRLTDKNGMFCLLEPEGRFDTEAILELMASFLLPISMKVMLETSRFNILDMADRMIRKAPGFTGPVALSYLTRARVRYADMLKWRSFLSSQQKAIHDKNVDYYQIDKELALMGEDAAALKTAVDVERMDASERFARLATWFALGLSLLSVASTMTAVAQFYLDDRMMLEPMVRVGIIAGGPVALIAMFVVVLTWANRRQRGVR